MAEWSETHTFLDGRWFEGNQPILGPRSHAFWLGSSVFDGARAFEGVTPDLDRHCERLNRSAKAMWLKPLKTVEEMLALTHEGVDEFAPGTRALHPADVLGRDAAARAPSPQDPESTRFLLTIYETPLPDPSKGISITRSPYAKPLPTMAPQAKAGCLYPNNARALLEAGRAASTTA